MGKDYLPSIKKFLDNQDVMLPVPTSMEPYFKPDSSLKAVIFDIYGTILISASGDIDESEITTENLKKALDSAGMKIPEQYTDMQHALSLMLDSFKREIIRVHQTERTVENPYPEVDILKIWKKILMNQQEENLLFFNRSACVECFTFIFEVLCNRIYPMPGMKEVIGKLAQKKIPLGIISNAQFYTPVILNYFLHNTLVNSEQITPFDPDLTVFSYKLMRSKPDIMLFETVKNNCRMKYNINASEILFLGNDMFRDIYPAQMAGFKTALFAGDSRSLRLRREKPEVNKLSPDFVITDLNQLLKIIM